MESPAPPAAPARRRWLYPILGVVVVAVVVIAALAATGNLPFGSKSSAPPTDLTFSQASSAASSRSGSVSGGPWYGVVAVAVLSRATILEPATNLTSVLADLNCTSHWISGQPSNVAIPATPTSAGTGTSAFWTVVLKNTTNVLLLETVSQGSASPVLTLTGANCSEAAGYLVSFGGGLQDSPSVVAAANAAGGASFLAEYPNATEFWGILGGLTYGIISTSAEWGVEYTSCSLPGGADSEGAVFNATVGGTSGVVTSHASGEVDCALTGASLPSLVVRAGFSAASPEKLFK